MSMSEYPEDIQKAAKAISEKVGGFVVADGHGGLDLDLSSVTEHLALAIHQERIRCIELAYKHYVYTPNRDGAKAVARDIADGKRA